MNVSEPSSGLTAEPPLEVGSSEGLTDGGAGMSDMNTFGGKAGDLRRRYHPSRGL